MTPYLCHQSQRVFNF